MLTRKILGFVALLLFTQMAFGVGFDDHSSTASGLPLEYIEAVNNHLIKQNKQDQLSQDKIILLLRKKMQ